MGKFFIGLLALITSISLYTSLRTAAWAYMVAPQYMEAQFETVRCNKYLALNYINEAVKENGLKNQVAPLCPFDKRGCDRAEKMWEDYEISLKKYKNHEWSDFLKSYFKTLIGI